MGLNGEIETGGAAAVFDGSGPWPFGVFESLPSSWLPLRLPWPLPLDSEERPLRVPLHKPYCSQVERAIVLYPSHDSKAPWLCGGDGRDGGCHFLMQVIPSMKQLDF